MYDKKRERVHAAVLNLINKSRGRDQLHDISLKRLECARDMPETVRVEIRAMKLRGCRPHELSSLPNRFAWFQFADLTQRGEIVLSNFQRRTFLALCRHEGVKAALALYEEECPEVPVRQFWESKLAEWWTPEEIWGNACNALRVAGIFPECAFLPPEVENLAGPHWKE